MTTPHNDQRWEKRLHEELRKLPELEAPPMLVSNVMAAIRAREEAAAKAWWKRPATAWSTHARGLLSIAGLLVFGTAVFALQIVGEQAGVSAEVGRITALGERIAQVWSALATLVGALGTALRASLSPVVLAILAGAGVAYLSLFALGGAFWRAVVLERRRS
ncbi:hypothetical protein ASA1KI_10700 [Opitutales bacterium ASA1]|uniref:hypothetical protein n=1 Tax=Congregicoccus parvus TaxID=3081749 RepID=UPI002B2F8E9F|nr:hypothetical protein ASA1KI_10700 [Opitutales bacterium ASA1]